MEVSMVRFLNWALNGIDAYFKAREFRKAILRGEKEEVKWLTRRLADLDEEFNEWNLARWYGSYSRAQTEWFKREGKHLQ